MAKLSEDELLSLLRREMYVAQGFNADILADKRARALDYYTGNTKSAYIPEAPAGRSNIVSSDVRDVHSSLLSQIAHCFKTSSIEFEPLSEEDEAQAQMETDTVKLQIDRNDGDKVFYEAIFSALLSGDGWIFVDVEESEDEEVFEHFDVGEPEVLAELLNTEENQELEVLEMTDDLSYLKLKVTTTTRRLVIKALDPANVIFSPAVSQYGFQELRFVAYRKLYTVAELMDFGMSEEDAMALPSHRDDYWPAIISREAITGTGGGSYYESSDNELGGKQTATTLKECYHCYAQLDIEDNGSYERIHVLMGGYDGAAIVYQEPVDYIPITHGSPLPMPHRTQGQGMYELMKDVQDGKTHTLRNYMDNLDVMNASRLVIVEGEVNKGDIENGRLNGYVRAKRPGMVEQLPATDIGMQAERGLNYLDRVRTQRGGASLDLNNSEMQVAQSSAAAAIGEYTAKEKMATLFAENMVKTLMKGTFLLVHKCLRTKFPGMMGAKIRGKWRQTDPSRWPEREHLVCVVGLNSQQRKEKIAGLQGLLQLQMAWMAQGGEDVIVTKSHVYNTACDLVRAAELGLPEQYLVDPESDESRQAQEQIRAQGERIRQQQIQLAREQTRLKEAELALKRYMHEGDLGHKYYDTNVDAGLQEAQLTVEALNKELDREQADNNPGEKPNRQLN